MLHKKTNLHTKTASHKKTALITGASSGIGKEFAKIHAAQGGDLIIVARRDEALNALKAELEDKYGVMVTCISCDLSQYNVAQMLFDKVQQTGIQVDYLINNAGFGLVGKFYELPLERQQQMIHLNMTTLTELMYLFLPKMVERNFGKILNTSSTASLVAGPNQAVYFATKAYVSSLSNAVASELHDTNVTVTALLPGATETEFGATSGMDKTALFAKTASARSVAEDGYNGMMKGVLDVISGLPLSTKLTLKVAPLVPKKMILKRVRKAQEIKV